MPRGRYAPSPTGALHLGNARTALVAWWQARSRGGSFTLRVEDLDEARTVSEAVQGNLDELRWLGIDWDEGPDVGGPHESYRQSERLDLYHQALERLEASGHLFECYLSRKDLRELASAPHGSFPVYGEPERRANERLAQAKRAGGKDPSVRFRVPDVTVEFSDLLMGAKRFDVRKEVGDFVVRRADNVLAYQLAVVVDDIAMGITEVVRGDDLLTSTAAQLLLYRALDVDPPEYAHVPLLLDETGRRMAKRKGSLTLSALVANGVRPERVVGLLAYSLGVTSVLEERSAEECLDHYELARLRQEPVSLTPAELAWLTGES
ncbi:MAG: tRNA glutamyl-Q(34) synthetase GluQRS [Trueperaceae bacterium]|nr:MAG: tRNA glutamyl-Q(34) synthetase GluQRS [Trueperaceae bacterium]